MKAATIAAAALLLAGQSVAQVPMSEGHQRRFEGREAVEKKYQITFETTRHKQYCKARVWTEYLQNNTVVSVNGGIINEDCGPSSGEFTISVRFKDGSGEVRNVEFVEQWQRDDDREALFQGEYFMGEDVDLIRVRARKVSCVCAESDETAEEADRGKE